MDWKIIIASIQSAGLSQAEIAKHCGCKQNTISYLRTGRSSDTTHTIGAALVDLLGSLKRPARKRIADVNKTN